MAKPTSKDEKLSWLQLLFPALLGVCLGLCVILGQMVVKPLWQWMFSTEYETQSLALREPEVLLEASGEHLIYRATGFGIQNGTPLHQALMLQQPDILSEYKMRATESRMGRNAPRDPWRVEVYFSITGEAGPLSSVLRTDYIFRGEGAHSLLFASTMLNEMNNESFDLPDVFQNPAEDLKQLNTSLCEAISEAKLSRIGVAEIKGDAFSCDDPTTIPTFTDAPAVFSASDQYNRLGGLTFYFSPGRLGPVGEGEYIITVSQDLFRETTKPKYRNLFRGEPPTL